MKTKASNKITILYNLTLLLKIHHVTSCCLCSKPCHATRGVTGSFRFVRKWLLFCFKLSCGISFWWNKKKNDKEKKKYPIRCGHSHIHYPSSLSFCCLDIYNICSCTSDVWKWSNKKHNTILNFLPHLTVEIKLYCRL